MRQTGWPLALKGRPLQGPLAIMAVPRAATAVEIAKAVNVSVRELQQTVPELIRELSSDTSAGKGTVQQIALLRQVWCLYY